MGKGRGKRKRSGGFFVTVGDIYDTVMVYFATGYMFLGGFIGKDECDDLAKIRQ